MIEIEKFGLIAASPRSAKIGQKFGRLTILAFGKKGRRVVHAVCKCDCGNMTAPVLSHMLRGRATSCGCFRLEQKAAYFSDKNTKHGLSNHRLYMTWLGMMTRCYNENHIYYGSYGGRGIKVCERWHEPSQFMSDIGARPFVGATLDRIDNDKDYSPENCRWASQMDQMNNRQSSVILDHDGRRQTVAQWARELGISKETIYARLRRGKPPF